MNITQTLQTTLDYLTQNSDDKVFVKWDSGKVDNEIKVTLWDQYGHVTDTFDVADFEDGVAVPKNILKMNLSRLYGDLLGNRSAVHSAKLDAPKEEANNLDTLVEKAKTLVRFYSEVTLQEGDCRVTLKRP